MVTVLIMLAFLSTLAIVVTETANFALRRTANQQAADQSRWYLRAAESYATAAIRTILSTTDIASVPAERWNGRSMIYPIEDGSLSLQLWDASNCFNLNGVIAVDGETNVARGRIQFGRLLDALNVRAIGGSDLTAALVDFIDVDEQRTAGGAEDESYASLATPYRTPNNVIADVGELRRVQGFEDPVIARLAPLVCVRQDALPLRLNVNTLRREDAPLLVVAFSGAITTNQAETMIRQRPRDGWPDVAAFMASAPLQAGGGAPQSGLEEQFTVRPRYITVSAHVVYRGARHSSLSLFDANGMRFVRRIEGAAMGDRRL